MQDDYYATFVAGVNALVLAASQDVPTRTKDISLADLSEILTQIERGREKRNREDRDEWERRLREKKWEREEKEEQDFCSARGVYIVYNGSRVYTYQDVRGGSRVVVSIRTRYHTYCKTCGDSSAKLRRGVCKICDVYHTPPYQKNEI